MEFHDKWQSTDFDSIIVIVVVIIVIVVIVIVIVVCDFNPSQPWNVAQ